MYGQRKRTCEHGYGNSLILIVLQPEVLAGLGQALYPFPKLPEGLGLLRIAVVQAVGESGWRRAYGSHISHRLSH